MIKILSKGLAQLHILAQHHCLPLNSRPHKGQQRCAHPPCLTLWQRPGPAFSLISFPRHSFAQPPALNYKLSSKISVVPRQAAELDQLPNALPHPVPQKPLKVHLVSVAGDVEAQALEHRETQTQGGEQHEKQIQAQEQHEQLVHASDFVILAARNEDKVSHIEVRNKNRKDYTFNINSMRSRVLHRAAQVHSGNTSKCCQGDCTSKEADEVLGSCHADALLCWLHPVHLWLAGLICA